MDETSDSDVFYTGVRVFRGFRSLMDPAHYSPVPDDWTIGTADVVQSTKAIAENRYKAVNMAAAAVVASVTNALGGREFPFVFGGDGASFAISRRDREAARAALAATATWASAELGLTLRVGAVAVAEVRAHGFDVLVARYAVSENLSYAMFSGGGVAWADAAMKRGEFAVTPAPPGTWPDLSGLSCRFREIRSTRGLILSVLVLPRSDSDPAAFCELTEEIVALAEQSPEAGRPVPAGGPAMSWPPPGVELQARTAKGDRRLRRAKVLVQTFVAFLIMRFGIRLGSFVPATYLRQVVENSDFRKYDDGLRMIIDCTPALADAIDRRLAAAEGIALYGLHRQESAIMTCFTQSALRYDHVHFIDGAQGGYTAAATALKAARIGPEPLRLGLRNAVLSGKRPAIS
jgi:hypothetical protein